VCSSDLDGFVAVRYAESGEPNSLYYLDGTDTGEGLWVASEPLDDRPGWRSVEPSTLVRAGANRLELEPLDLEARSGGVGRRRARQVIRSGSEGNGGR